jgi:hypothetical protein
MKFHEAESFWRMYQSAIQGYSPYFMELEDTLPYSQVHTADTF